MSSSFRVRRITRAAVAGQAVSLSLALQVVGGVAATRLAGRIRWLSALIGCAVVGRNCVRGICDACRQRRCSLRSPCALGFVWLFATPFLVPMTIEADPTRRAALLIGGAQLVGGSLGPLFASFFVTDVGRTRRSRVCHRMCDRG